jgi:hypothetical protein
VELTPYHKKNKIVMNLLQESRTWMDSLDKQPKQRNVDTRFGTWNDISLYRAGSLVTVTKELSETQLIKKLITDG